MEVKTIQGRWCLKVYWVGVCSYLATKRREMVGWSDGWLFGRLGCWMVGQLNNWMQGGLAARSGTEFIWSPAYRPPQLRSLAEWDWVPFSFKTKCRHGGTMSFCSVLSFQVHFDGIVGHQEAWCINSSWVTTLCVIRRLGKFSYL